VDEHERAVDVVHVELDEIAAELARRSDSIVFSGASAAAPR
jgi:hypothetical protein